MMLSIVMPTIAGREKELTRSLTVYAQCTPGVEIEWLIEKGHPTCGAAWNAGAAKATGDILHMAADDIEPQTAAWFPAALAVLERGGVPLGWVREDWGWFGRDFCRVVICRREWWPKLPDEMHYWNDNLFTDLMVKAGHAPRVAPGFDFFHRRSMIGRGAGMSETDRLEHDRELYKQAMSNPDQLS
jgi:hypothetical protein